MAELTQTGGIQPGSQRARDPNWGQGMREWQGLEESERQGEAGSLSGATERGVRELELSWALPRAKHFPLPRPHHLQNVFKERLSRVPSLVVDGFSPNILLTIRTIKHKRVNSKETTEISTQRCILNLAAWKQGRWSPGSPKVPLTKNRGKWHLPGKMEKCPGQALPPSQQGDKTQAERQRKAMPAVAALTNHWAWYPLPFPRNGCSTVLWAPGTNSITAHPMGCFKIGNIKCFLVTEPRQLLHHVFFCFCVLHHVLIPSPQNNLEVHTVIIPISGWGKLRLSDVKFAQCCLTSEQEGEEPHPTPVRGHRKIPSEAFFNQDLLLARGHRVPCLWHRGQPVGSGLLLTYWPLPLFLWIQHRDGHLVPWPECKDNSDGVSWRGRIDQHSKGRIPREERPLPLPMQASTSPLGGREPPFLTPTWGGGCGLQFPGCPSSVIVALHWNCLAPFQGPCSYDELKSASKRALGKDIRFQALLVTLLLVFEPRPHL